MKTIEAANYAIFRTDLDKRLKDKGYDREADVPMDELSETLAKMMVDGTYFGTTDANGGMQDLAKKGRDMSATDQSTEVIGYMGQMSNAGAVKEVTSTVKKMLNNLGAVGVVEIHNKDGRAMIAGHNTETMNIYDALMLGIREENAQQAKDMNKAFMDVSRDRSVLGEAINRLARNLDKMGDLKTVDAMEMIDDLARAYEVKPEEVTREVMQEKIQETLDTVVKVQKGRKVLESTELLANQYYVSDAYEGYADKARTSRATGTIDVKNAQTAMKGVGKMFSQLARELDRRETKAESQAVEGIIGKELTKDEQELNKKVDEGC